MKINLSLSEFNSVLSISYKKKLAYSIIGTIAIIFIKAISNFITEKRSCNARKEREALLGKNLIKEEKDIRAKLKKEFFKEREMFRIIEENALNADKHTPSEKHFKKLLRQRIFRKKPFKNALEDVSLKTLKPSLVSGTKAEGIPIGRYRTFKNEPHPFQSEYDSLPEHVKKALARENSLFLSGKLDKKAKIDLMKNVDFIGDASKLEEKKEDGSPRFIGNWCGVSNPVLDSFHNIFYKPFKHPNIDTTAALLRYHIKELKIDNIILPKRECWATRNQCILSKITEYHQIETDGSTLISNLMLEEYIEGLFSDTDCETIYTINPPEVFKDIVTNITKIFCFLEIGDLDHKIFDCVNNRMRTIIHLRNKSGKYIVETDNPDFPSQCRFGNLPMKIDKNSRGDSCVKLVLVDLDSVRKPDHTTVEKLLRMFPRHQQLIVDTIQETNPALFEGYDPNPEFRKDEFAFPDDLISTRDELISNYLNNKGKPEVEDKAFTIIDR